MIKKVVYLMCVYFVFIMHVYSCDFKPNNALLVHELIKIDDGFLYFYKTNQGKSDKSDPYSSPIEQYELDFHQYNCSNKTDTVVDTIGYMAAPPFIESVFFAIADNGKSKDTFIITSWDTRTDPIEGNVGKLYSVSAYKNTSGHLVIDDPVTRYFGSGIDKMKNGKLVKYPFKTAADIRKEIKSDKYKEWLISRK